MDFPIETTMIRMSFSLHPSPSPQRPDFEQSAAAFGAPGGMGGWDSQAICLRSANQPPTYLGNDGETFNDPLVN